jgi:hypothetical protein
MRRLYGFDGSPEFVANYRQWDDARFLETFCPGTGPAPGNKSGRMLRRLRERKLLKEVFRDKIGPPYDTRSWETLKGLHKSKAIRLAKAVEERVCDLLNHELGLKGESIIEADSVIAHSYAIKSARESSRNDEAGIIVNVRPSPQEFTTVSTLFNSINEVFQDNHIVVFAPVEWPDPARKAELRSQWLLSIREMIQDEWRKLK